MGAGAAVDPRVFDRERRVHLMPCLAGSVRSLRLEPGHALERSVPRGPAAERQLRLSNARLNLPSIRKRSCAWRARCSQQIDCGARGFSGMTASAVG